MFFTKFDPLTKAYVDEKIGAAPAACGASCPCLSGMKFSVKLEGEFAPKTLSYEIKDEKTLKVKENGKSFTAGYAAISQGRITVLTHLIPGTDRGWHLVIDRGSWAVTAFETWFGITVPVGGSLGGDKKPTGSRDIPREIQRQYYFGWIDKGDNAKPEKLHTPTNRIEGRGLHWKFDTGYEILSFNPSTCCTTFSELGGEMGGITMTNPADYIRIDDENYIYARWEVEFSGKMWLEVMNFFDFTAAGVEFGFEADNSLTYRLHRAELERTGDVAHLEMITDYGDKERPMSFMNARKGGRYSYRPADIDIPMTRQEALKHAKEVQNILNGEANIMNAFNTMPLCSDLAGKSFKIWNDREKYAQAPWSGDKGSAWEYRIIDGETLKWRHGGRNWKEEKYACFQADKELFFFAHMLTGDPDYSMAAQVVDFRNGLTTTVKTGIGNWHIRHTRFAPADCARIE